MRSVLLLAVLLVLAGCYPDAPRRFCLAPGAEAWEGPVTEAVAQWSAATGEAAYVSRTCTPTAVIVSQGPTRWGTDGQYSHNPVDGAQIRFLPGRPPRLPIALHEVGHAFGAEHTGAGVMHPERAAGWCIDAVSAATVGGRSTCKD